MAHNSSELVPYLKEVITKERAVFETVMDQDDEEEDYEPETYAVANATRILLEFRNPDIVNFLFENVFDDEDFSIVSMQYNDYFHFTVMYMMSLEFDTFRENVLAMSFENSNLTICQDVLTCLGHFHPELKEKSEKLIAELFELYRKEASAEEEQDLEKLLEGIYALLNSNELLYPILFDFAEPWKVDI